MGTYQRFPAPGFTPFDPRALAKETERIITRSGPEGLEREYTDIYSAPVCGGIATAYAVGAVPGLPGLRLLSAGLFLSRVPMPACLHSLSFLHREARV